MFSFLAKLFKRPSANPPAEQQSRNARPHSKTTADFKWTTAIWRPTSASTTTAR